MLVENWDKYLVCIDPWRQWPCEKMKTTVQMFNRHPTVYVPVQQTWIWAPCCHLNWSCCTTSPVRVMVCRSEYIGCCSLLPFGASTWVSGWTIDMWTFKLWAFSKRFPQIRQANSKSASALCLVMWYFSDARWRHWKPHTSHLKSQKHNSIYIVCLLFLLLLFKPGKTGNSRWSTNIHVMFISYGSF